MGTHEATADPPRRVPATAPGQPLWQERTSRGVRAVAVIGLGLAGMFLINSLHSPIATDSVGDRAVALGIGALALWGFSYFPFYVRMVVTSRGVWVHNLFRAVWVPWGELTDVTTNDRVVLHTGDWSVRVTAVQRANAAAMTGARSRVDRVREHLLVTRTEQLAQAGDEPAPGAWRGPVPVPWVLLTISVAWVLGFLLTLR